MTAWTLTDQCLCNYESNSIHQAAQALSKIGTWNEKIEDNAMVFYERDKQIFPRCHNRPLYVTTYVVKWS